MSTYPTQMQGVRSSKLSGIASLALTGNLVGFLMVSYIPDALGVNSRVATIPFRALMLAFLIYACGRILKSGHLRMQISPTSLLVIFFWVAYCLRFFVDAAVLQVPLGSSPAEMALYLFGIVIPTFIVLYLIRDIGLYRRALTWTLLGLGTCCLISMLRTRTARDLAKSGIGYDANDVVNHILYGHMGVTAVILGLFVFLRIGRAGEPWYIRSLGGGVACLGVFTVFASGSRGALIAGVFLVPVVFYLGWRRGSRVLTVSACLALGFVFSATVGYLSSNGMRLDRVMLSFTAYNAEGNSVYYRQSMLRDAWREYLEHPLTGSSIVERNTLSYPHNVILEGFMATGTFGGTAFVLLVLLASYRAFRFMSSDPVTAWIPLCFLQQLIGSMFSGGLYGNMLLWGMMAIMLGARVPNSREEQQGNPESRLRVEPRTITLPV
jgi:hypothetical protein